MRIRFIELDLLGSLQIPSVDFVRVGWGYIFYPLGIFSTLFHL
jgi:hypothetical protein